MKPILLALACIYGCQAQATTQLEGQITNGVTGEPLKNVFVQLLPRSGTPVSSSDIHSVVTGASGRFVFNSLPAGSYTIMTLRTGYVQQSFGLPLVDPSQPPASVSIRLTPFGRIEGRVTDEDGEPYRGQISLEGLATRGPAEISGDGTYVLEAAAGRYYVRALDLNTRVGGEMTGTWPRETDVATYYPSSTTTSGATKVNVAAGAIVRGIDIRIRRVTVYTVRGHAINASTGKAAANVPIALDPGGPRFPGQAIATQSLSDGSFEFKDVPPGAYSVSTEMRWIAEAFGVSPPLFSVTPVVVGKENVEDVDLVLRRGAEIHGAIRMESGEPVKQTAPWRVALRSGDGDGDRGNQIQSDGSFVISEIPPRKFALQIFPQPPQTYIKSVRLNQQDITGQQVDLTSGAGGIMEIVLSSHVAEVSGIIRDASGAPVPHVRVTLWKPGEPARTGTTTDGSGTFRIGSLAPGEYRIAAWAKLPDGGNFTAEFVSQFDGRAAAVNLEEDAHVNVDAPLIPKQAIDQAEESVQ